MRISPVLGLLGNSKRKVSTPPTSLRVKLRPPVRPAYFLSSAERLSFSWQTQHRKSYFFCLSFIQRPADACKGEIRRTLCSIDSRLLLSFKKLSFSRWACWVICAACFFRVNRRSWRKSTANSTACSLLAFKQQIQLGTSGFSIIDKTAANSFAQVELRRTGREQILCEWRCCAGSLRSRGEAAACDSPSPRPACSPSRAAETPGPRNASSPPQALHSPDVHKGKKIIQVYTTGHKKGVCPDFYSCSW